MEKFEVLKDQIKDSGEKFNQYQEDIELKKVETKTLETELENLRTVLEKSTAV
jgi:hypothetical protein